MASPPSLTRPDQPHLVSLVLQSKKALQHGEQLCIRANALSIASAECAVDVLALDAKVKWMSDAVLEQMRLAASVAKSLEEKRRYLVRRVQEWDSLRVQHADALDTVLEGLGSQLVPPGFHQSSSDSSLFGSQSSEEKAEGNGSARGLFFSSQRTATAALRRDSHVRKNVDRKNWKTLRDFVDERAIEEALENMEKDRTALDNILGVTEGYSETLDHSISIIRYALPRLTTSPAFESILMAQAKASQNMAGHLESLTAHYDQMAEALHESEGGEVFSEEDLQDMNRDTEELPSIMAELDESIRSIESSHEQLLAAKDAGKQQLDNHHSILNDLDELGEIMVDMLQRQQNVERDCEEQFTGLQDHLIKLEDLHRQFLSFRNAFDKLLIEIARRRLYREAAENIVKGMMAQLEAMSEEEHQVRIDFNSDHGAYLPEDICLCVENPPTKWEIVPLNGEVLEVLPHIDSDLVNEAKERLGGADEIGGTESL